MTLLQKLSQPYPFHTFNESIRRNLFFSIFLTLFLLIFRPFGLHVYHYEESYLIAGYGVVSFLTILFCDFMSTHSLKKLFNEDQWTVYKQILYALAVLFFLGWTNYVYAFLIGAFPGTIFGFLKVQLYVFLSSILPITVVILWRQNYSLKKNLCEADSLSAVIGSVVPETNQAITENNLGEITFTGENNKDFLSVSADDLTCIISKENYIEIIWQKDNKTEKTLLRSTLTKAEEKLSGINHFFRSHRAYLVNLKKVISVEGNAQGYRLSIDGLSETVPVARGKASALRNVLNR